MNTQVFRSSQKHSSGANFGFEASFYEHNGSVFAKVQKVKFDKYFLEFDSFGPYQTPKEFKEIIDAKSWAISTAKQRASQ